MAACVGRLLVEVFEDAAPLAARHFLNRCREGSSEGLQGTCLHRLVPDLGFFFGTSRGCGAAGADSPQLFACPCCACLLQPRCCQAEPSLWPALVSVGKVLVLEEICG